MIPTLSFGERNHGFQVGLNNGHIDNRVAKPAQITQGGSTFNGNISAARDININHITTRAVTLFRSSLGASSLFNQVQSDLGLLHSILTVTGQQVRECDLSDDQSHTLEVVLKSCDEAFLDLSRLKERFDNVDPEKRSSCERLELGFDQIQNIRARLTTYSQTLNLLATELTRSSQANIERLLEKFIKEVQSGQRDGSAFSDCSLAPDEGEAWREVRKDLQSVGITPGAFRQNRNFIISKLRESFQGFGLTIPKDTQYVMDIDGVGNTEAFRTLEDVTLAFEPSQIRSETIQDSLLNGGRMSRGGMSVGNRKGNGITDTIMPLSSHSPSYLPELEAHLMRDFSCCGATLPTMADLLQHYEEAHATKSPKQGHWPSNGGNWAPLATTAIGQQESQYILEREADLMRKFSCCGVALPTFGDLLQHYEEDHATKPLNQGHWPSNGENWAPLATTAIGQQEPATRQPRAGPPAR